MKNNEANIFVFIASIIVGIMISLNISFSNKGTTTYLDTKHYVEASKIKNNLYEDLDILNEQYNASYSKLSKYESADASNAKVLQEMKIELEQNRMYIGAEKMHGPGVKIVIDDAPYGLIPPNGDVNDYIVHNRYIAMVINELKLAGAEAISLNGNRIMDRTGVFCEGNLIRVNDIQIWRPFVIEAIGNPNVLMEYMKRDGGYLSLIQTCMNVYVDTYIKDDIVMPGYEGSLTSKYLKDVKKKK